MFNLSCMLKEIRAEIIETIKDLKSLFASIDGGLGDPIHLSHPDFYLMTAEHRTTYINYLAKEIPQCINEEDLRRSEILLGELTEKTKLLQEIERLEKSSRLLNTNKAQLRRDYFSIWKEFSDKKSAEKHGFQLIKKDSSSSVDSCEEGVSNPNFHN